MASGLKQATFWLATALLLLSTTSVLQYPAHAQPTALDTLPNKQPLTLPIDTSQPDAFYQPIDLRITFTTPAWAINETTNAVRVGVDDGSGLQELESQIYDLQHTDESHISAASLVFLIPPTATGKEKYYVLSSTTETTPANYPKHLSLDDTHYFYEPIPGQTIDFDYYGIRQDGYVVYTVVQKGQLLGNPVAFAAIKFKPNSTTVETLNLDQLGDFDFRYGLPGIPDYIGSAYATDITKTVLATGPLMIRVRLQATAPRGDIATDNIYTYYYNPTNAKRIMVDAHHTILKPITPDNPAVVDGDYAGIVSIKARSASIEKMNVGDILPTVFVNTPDNATQTFTVPTNPQSTTKEMVISPQDDLSLGPQAWVCLNDPATGKVHAIILSDTTGITNGTDEGVQVNAYSQQNIKLPGLEADTGSLTLTRHNYQDGHMLTTFDQGRTYQYKLEFITVETGGQEQIAQDSTYYRTLIKDAPVYHGNASTNKPHTTRYNLTASVRLAHSVPLGSLLSAALGKNISYIYAELYQQTSFRSSGSVGRLSLGAINLNMTGKTLRQKIQMILGIFDLKNSSLTKKIRFPDLDPGTYVVKIYRENPRFSNTHQYIGVAVVNLTDNTRITILCRPQSTITITLKDQTNTAVPNAKCTLRLADTTIAETTTDDNGTAHLTAPSYPHKAYHLHVQYQGFTIADQPVTLRGLKRIIGLRETFSLERYSLTLTVTDTWGFAPAVDLNPTLVSPDMTTATILRATTPKAGAYQFTSLLPASYQLTLGYKTFKVEQAITLQKDMTLSAVFPAEFPLNLTLYDATGDPLSTGTISVQRNGHTKTSSITSTGTATIVVPPGDYDLQIHSGQETIAKEQIPLRGDKTLAIVTSQGSFFHLAVSILGVLIAVGALAFFLWKKQLQAGLKLAVVGLLVIALVSPWWVLNGSSGGVTTTTSTLLVPPQLVSFTTSSNASGGEISTVPAEVTMVLGLLSLLVGVACILLILSLVLSGRLRKTTMLVTLLSIIVLLLTLVVFYYAFSQLTQVGVGSFMGSGSLEVTLPGGVGQTSIPCSWGPGIGLYLLIVSFALVLVAFVGRRLSKKIFKR